MRSFYLLLTVLISSVAYAQPQAFKYQSVVRDANGDLLINKNVAFQISIVEGAIDGGIVYTEVHQAVTSSYGSVTLEIGRGENPTTDFSEIDWAVGSHFVQVAWDLTGGTNYELAGISELLSVPYALNAKVADNGIPSGQAGEMLYNTGTEWTPIASGSQGEILTFCDNVPTWTTNGQCPIQLEIGDEFQGGIVAYILQPGDPGYVEGEVHGLIAAPSDQSAGISWNNGSNIVTGATGVAIGTGQANTAAIVAAQGEGAYAAKICADLTLGDFSDWYLPSRTELIQLYTNRVAIGGFAIALYWSSTDGNASAAVAITNLGMLSLYTKVNTLRVRAVRSF